MEYLKSKKVQTIILIVVSSIIILVILYGAFFHNRTKRCIKNINLKFKKILHIQSLSRNKKIMKGNYKLSDCYG